MMVKGEMEVQVLYETDAARGETDTAVFTLPFSQIVDIDGLDSDAVCDARLEVLSVQVQLDSSSTSAVFEAELRGVLTVTAWRMQTINAVLDAYSTAWEGDPVTETVQLRMQHEPVERILEVQGTLPDCRLATVTDAWSDLRSFNAAVKDGALQWSGRLGVSLLMQDEEGKATYRETVLEMTDRIPWDDADVRLNPDIAVEHMAYRLNGAGELEIRARVRMSGPVQTVQRCQVVREFAPDPQRPRVRDTACGLILYYAEAGESIWQIARRCCADEACIREENDLQGDVMDMAGMLLIPTA
jgi:hypothetical protein